MNDETRGGAVNPGYVTGLLARALTAAREGESDESRARAAQKIARFTAVLDGMRAGALDVGSRTPVAGAPAWATLEVVKGGFATGALLAGGPLLEHERAWLERIPNVRLYASERAAINGYCLTEAGLAELAERLERGTYRVHLPEEGALLTVAWLLRHGERARALDVLEAIAPFFDRLRFYPIPDERPLSDSSLVRLMPASAVAQQLRRKRTPRAIVMMRDYIARWAPLSDRAAQLLARAVHGAPPALAHDAVGSLVRDGKGQLVVEGGALRTPDDAPWLSDARALLKDVAFARARGAASKRNTERSESFSVMIDAIERLTRGETLSEGAQRRVKRVLATIARKRGIVGSARNTALRAAQRRALEAPLHASLAAVVSDRLSKVERDAGLAAVEPFVAPVSDDEAREGAPRGAAIPSSFEAKVRRAWEAPIDQLVQCNVIPSGEVLAIVAPQVTASVRAAGVTDSSLRRLYASVYAAFRRRRSLLLLELEKQVGVHELPWVAAIDAYRSPSLDTRTLSRQTLEQLAWLAITSYPEAILPNKLLRELAALVKGAGLSTPIVEELAADIFMGAFSEKFVASALVTARLLRGSLYERYYALPFDELLASRFEKDERGAVPAFAALCERLARLPREARWSVARNGAIIEQQQLLTSHNLAALFTDLSLRERCDDERLSSLARRCLQWILAQRSQRVAPGKADLQRLKNCAYAWRQMIFFLSLAREETRRAFVPWARASLDEAKDPFRTRFQVALRGLAMVIDGGAFDEAGVGMYEAREARRFLGWTIGRHWLFEPLDPREGR